MSDKEPGVQEPAATETVDPEIEKPGVQEPAATETVDPEIAKSGSRTRLRPRQPIRRMRSRGSRISSRTENARDCSCRSLFVAF